MKSPALAALILSLSLPSALWAQTGSSSARARVQNPSARAQMATRARGPSKPAATWAITPLVGATSSSFAGVEGKDGFKLENLTGYQGGLLVLFGRSSWQFETGLVMAERGAKGVFNGSSVQASYIYQLRYLELPLLAKYSFQPPSRDHFFVKIGAVLAHLQDAQHKVDEWSVDYYERPGDYSAKEGYQDVDARLALGAGGQIRFGSGFAWVIQGDYQRGLAKVNKQGEVPMYNGSIGISTGLLIDL